MLLIIFKVNEMKELRNNYVCKKIIVTFLKSNHCLMESFMLRWLGRNRGRRALTHHWNFCDWSGEKMSRDLPAWYEREWYLTRAQEGGLCPVPLPGEADYCLGGWGLLCLPTAEGQECQGLLVLEKIWVPPSKPSCLLLLQRGRSFTWGSQGSVKVIGQESTWKTASCELLDKCRNPLWDISHPPSNLQALTD